MDETIEKQQQEAVAKSNSASPKDTTSHMTFDSPKPSDTLANQSTPGMVCAPTY